MASAAAATDPPKISMAFDLSMGLLNHGSPSSATIVHPPGGVFEHTRRVKKTAPTPTLYAARLREAMHRRGKTNSELAAYLGVSPTAIGKIFAGTTKSLTAENHIKAAYFLEVSSEWLALGEGKMLAINMPMRNLNGIEGQLITFFRGMSERDQERLIAAANNLFNRAQHAKPTQANPFATLPKPPQGKDAREGSSGRESGLGELL